MADRPQKQGREPLFGAAIPLVRPARLKREQVAAELADVVALAGARVRMLEAAPARRGLLGGLMGTSGEPIRCEVAGIRISIEAAARPLCKPSVIHSFINPAVWRGSIGWLAEHKAHVLIAEEGAAGAGRDAIFDRATAVTLATAVVADLVGAEAAIWLPGRNAVPMSVFGAEMERFIDGQAPLRFWLRWHVLPAPVQSELELGKLSGEPLNPGVATIGMTPFIGAELVAPPSVCERDVMLDQIYALASAVIDENVELKDGAVYGRADGIMVRVNLRKSGPYGERPYWELSPRPAPAPRARPLFDVAGEAPKDGTPKPELRLRLIVPGR